MRNDYILKRIGIKRKSKKIYLRDNYPLAKIAVFVQYPEEAKIFESIEDYLGDAEIKQKLGEFRMVYGIPIRFVRRDVEICKYYESGNGL